MSDPCFFERSLVLLVADDPATIGTLAAALTTAGYGCRCCRNEAEAQGVVAGQAHAARRDDETIRAAADADRRLPELIIADANLAGASGWRLCERLKQQPGMECVPVMLLSATQTPDIIRHSHEAGGTYSLRKPLDPAVLLELVDQALWAHRRELAHA